MKRQDGKGETRDEMNAQKILTQSIVKDDVTINRMIRLAKVKTLDGWNKAGYTKKSPSNLVTGQLVWNTAQFYHKIRTRMHILKRLDPDLFKLLFSI